MRSRLGMFAYYQKKGGWGAGPLTLPGGIGYQYTYLLTYGTQCLKRTCRVRVLHTTTGQGPIPRFAAALRHV